MEVFGDNTKKTHRTTIKESMKLIGFIYKKKVFLQHVLKTNNYDI